MRQLYILLSLLFSTLHCQGQGFMLNKHFYKHMQGNIAGKYDIVLDLERNDTLLEGYYYYLKVGKPIALQGNINEKGIIKLKEYTDTAWTATIEGRFLSDSILQGQWVSRKPGSQPLSFGVREHYYPGSVAMKAEFINQRYEPGKKNRAATYIVYLLKTVSGAKESVLDTVNNVITAHAVGAEYSMTLRDAAQEFFNAYDEDMAGEEDSEYPTEYYYSSRTYVMYNANNLLSVVNSSELYTGGAHGIQGSEGLVFSLKDGRRIDGDDIFKDEYDEDAFAEVIKKKLRQLYNIPPGKSLESGGFLTDDVEVTDNFYLTSGGITFIYNPYEISSYAMGEIDVFVSYAELKAFLQPGVLPFVK